jgi:hypothetical protein
LSDQSFVEAARGPTAAANAADNALPPRNLSPRGMFVSADMGGQGGNACPRLRLSLVGLDGRSDVK